jgi:hypothetical protein
MTAASALRARVRALDWTRVAADLDATGFARIPRLLSASECRALAALYTEDRRFRSTVSMERHRFGAGEYRYFARPLPATVAALRTALYPPLASIANRWQERLGTGAPYPARHAGFLERCRAAGQTHPTPLLLSYDVGGYNRLHQDLYGAVAFPLQVAFLLSRPGRDFEGGEFLLHEQRPRMQSRADAIALRQGEAIVFPNRERPVRGVRGFHRAQHRHGVSRLYAGRRLALGVIFHDAK